MLATPAASRNSARNSYTKTQELRIGTRTLCPVYAPHRQVEISSIAWRDWNTGQETDFTDVNCGVFYYDGAVADTVTTNSACILGGGTGETVASATDVSDGCKNALASVCYTVSTCQIVLSLPLVAPASLQHARAAQVSIRLSTGHACSGYRGTILESSSLSCTQLMFPNTPHTKHTAVIVGCHRKRVSM